MNLCPRCNGTGLDKPTENQIELPCPHCQGKREEPEGL